MKNYQTLWLQIREETERQTWWETREQHRGWGQSHVPLGGCRDLYGSHEEVETVDTFGSVLNKNKETKDKHVLTLIVANSMLHTLIRNSERYLSIDVQTELCEENKYPEASSKIQDGSLMSLRQAHLQGHLNLIQHVTEFFLFTVFIVSPVIFLFETYAFEMMYSIPRLSFPIFENWI